MDEFDTLLSYFEYPFVRYALIVGILVSLCASLLGVPLVLKRMSIIGDGLSHMAFGALAVAAVLKLRFEMPFIMLVTTIVAILLLHGDYKKKVRGDAAIAMIASGSLAIGYLLLNTFGNSANISGDVCSTLFGSTSILTLSLFDVWLCIGVSLIVILVFLIFYNKIFSVTFDPSFAVATGIKCNVYDDIIAIITAIVIVLSMHLVGALLVSALIVFPAISAMRVFGSFKSVTICASLISVICALGGIIFSIFGDTPVGATIVAFNILIFALLYIVGRFVRI